MESEKILTLAMSETTKDKYVVLGFNLKEEKVLDLEISEKNFRDKNGNNIWDIGAITEVEKIINKGNKYYIYGDCVLKKYLSKSELKKLLYREIMDYNIFIRDKKFSYVIVKSKYIEKLKNNKDENRTKCYLEFWVNGKKVKHLVKDYRWINYWSNKIDNGATENEINERERYYRDFFNEKDTYLILYRYNNYRKKTDIYWIAAVHYFGEDD